MSLQTHNIPPVWDENSRILILGSFPSVKSREEGFFYAHPQNRFWKVCAAVFGAQTPLTIDEKKSFLLSNGIALWDVIASCDIAGSSDSSVRNALPNDISRIINNSKVKSVYVNGALSAKLYDKHIRPVIGINAIRLPSTSPANAAWSFDALCDMWKIILE